MTSLAAFDAAVLLTELRQMRLPPSDVTNLVVFFRHGPTNRVLAYELTANTWSDATALRDWDAPAPPTLRLPSHQVYLSPLR